MIEHHLVRATVLPEILSMIMQHDKVDEDEALNRFYSSVTGRLYANDETGLYGQSALYIFGMYCEEKQNNHSPMSCAKA